MQLVRMLNEISIATCHFIPLCGTLLEVLAHSDLKQSLRPTSLKPLDFEVSLRAPNQYLRTRTYAVCALSLPVLLPGSVQYSLALRFRIGWLVGASVRVVARPLATLRSIHLVPRVGHAGDHPLAPLCQALQGWQLPLAYQAARREGTHVHTLSLLCCVMYSSLSRALARSLAGSFV